MHIRLTPVRSDLQLQLSRKGDVVSINGQAYDLSGIPDGATLPRDAIDCDMLASDVERIDGRLHFTLILPHGPEAADRVLFPAPLMDPPDGVISLPTEIEEIADAG